MEKMKFKKHYYKFGKLCFKIKFYLLRSHFVFVSICCASYPLNSILQVKQSWHVLEFIHHYKELTVMHSFLGDISSHFTFRINVLFPFHNVCFQPFWHLINEAWMYVSLTETRFSSLFSISILKLYLNIPSLIWINYRKWKVTAKDKCIIYQTKHII